MSDVKLVKSLGWMSRWLMPGQRLMAAMSLPVKLSLIAACVMLPLALMYTSVMLDRVSALQYVDTEIDAVQIEQALLPFLVSVEHHHNRFSALKSAVDAVEAFSLEKEMGLMAQAIETSSGDALQQHREVLNAVRVLSMMSAEKSGLVLDPEARSYFLMDALINAVQPAMRELSMQVAADSLSQGSHTVSSGQVAVIVFNLEQVAAKMQAFVRAGGQPLMAMDVIDREVRAGLANATVESRSNALGSLSELHQALTVELTHELQERRARTIHRMVMESAAFLFGMCTLTYLLFAFVASFRKSVQTLHAWIHDIAAGDLAQRPSVMGHDELASLGRVIGRMTDSLSALVAEIRNSAAMVNLTGEYVARGSARLAHRTEEQASSLRNSVSAITQLGAAVQQNAHSARSLNEMTVQLKGTAEQGKKAMSESLRSMAAMQAASREVAEIVMVLDDIAFQTTMLSLNASIEASKAGEAGRGFSVVAASVKELAQRCAEATERIRSLIGVSVQQVEESKHRLDLTSGVLDQVVSGVRDVSSQLQLISESTVQQSSGLQEVQHSVGCLDDITRQNAALVEQSSTASNALLSRADALKKSVASMKLMQGSPEEALSLVQRGLDTLKRVGRQQAFSLFHDPLGGFIDRDLYLFAFDRSGVCLALGAQPRFVGMHVSDVPGLSDEFVQAAWVTAENGGGWISYQFINPLTHAVSKKESYVVAVDSSLFIGCGVYKSVDEAMNLAFSDA
jgi:methyl-accepting chemotaxis protein